MQSSLKVGLLLSMLAISHWLSGQNYVEIGAGAAIWHTSHIRPAENERLPIQLHVEYGWIYADYTLTAIYDFFSTYRVDNYELNPSFAGLFVNRLLHESNSRTIDIQTFGSIGALYELHRFLDRGNANVPGYELEEERKQGFGVGLRIFSKIFYDDFVITPQIQFFRSNRNFIAGQFSDSNFQTGSTRILLSIGYRFGTHGASKISCPTYY